MEFLKTGIISMDFLNSLVNGTSSNVPEDSVAARLQIS